MQLDFSKLANISSKEPPEATAQATEPQNSSGKDFIFNGAPKQGTGQNKRPQQQAGPMLEKLRAESGNIVAEHIEAQKKSRKLRGEILQGLARGENMAALLLKAMKCIELTTGESNFSMKGADYIRAVYAKSLKEPEAVAVSISQVRQRLELLQKARSREQDERDKRLIDTAIKTAEAEIIELQTI